MLVTNTKWFINSLTGYDHHHRTTISHRRCLNFLEELTQALLVVKATSIYVDSDGSSPWADDRRGTEQMKEEPNETLSIRMCIWVKDSNMPTF